MFESLLAKHTFQNIIPTLKLNPDCLDITIYDDILVLFNEIYNESYSSNLRGAFLELLTFKFINKKFNPHQSDLDCYVVTSGIKSERTVDVFALCDNFKGMVCECKISHNNFRDYHISNLNNIFHGSNEILAPYIVTCSSKKLITDKLIKIVREHNTNRDVYLGHVKVISNSNLSDFFK
ncbi:hypothetical protein [Methanobrevibacter sp.]|uniref:hypothetical protein n=1 Tax=Methanobrevibacter sp. TaxID=66852 RepID=UPI00388E7443